MSGPTRSAWLCAYAAATEGRGLAGDGPQWLELGIGKAAAALRLATRLATGPRPAAVLLFGVAGAWPARLRGGAPPVGIGEVCVVGTEQFGDEGVATSTGFLDVAALGLGAPPSLRLDTAGAAALGLPVVRGVTVSTCSGTEDLAAERWRRLGGDVETMEGAAVALVCQQFAVPLVQVRSISNWTGDRARADWNLPQAVAAVQAVVRRLCG